MQASGRCEHHLFSNTRTGIAKATRNRACAARSPNAEKPHRNPMGLFYAAFDLVQPDLLLQQRQTAANQPQSRSTVCSAFYATCVRRLSPSKSAYP